MMDILRQEIAMLATTVVVKVGTRVLTDEHGRLNEGKIADLAGEINRIIESGRKVVLVSSGAVGAGMGRMGLQERPTDLSHLQALASLGQSLLVETYHRTFASHGHAAAQVLLTADVLEERDRYLNARNTLLTLLDYGAIPVINENDAIAVDELRVTFGDNDQLAAIVANIIQAPLLILLSDVEGLFDADPSDPGAQVVPTITKVDETTFELVKDKKTGVSKGGMASKLRAARKATRAGGNVIIANGGVSGTLDRIMAGRLVGTLFLAENQSVAARKRWIGFAVAPRGSVVLDPGACAAVQHHGRSLLSIGISGVVADFDKGDVVRVQSSDGEEIARGLTNYSSDEIRRIQGLRTDKILQVLGYCPYEEVIHRDNMVIL